MNLFVLWMRRRALISVLLILLLTVGSVFGSVGVSAYVLAGKQTAAAAGLYTTVAIPYDPVWLGRTPVESYDEKTGPRYRDLEALLKDAPVTVRYCPAVPLQGVVWDSVPLKPSDYDTEFTSYGMSDYPYECCVLAVRCASVTDKSEERLYLVGGGDGAQTESKAQRVRKYAYTFSVEKPISLPILSENQVPPNDAIYMETGICRPDGSPLFEPGKTYFLFGRLFLLTVFNANTIVPDISSSLDDAPTLGDLPTEFGHFSGSILYSENGQLSMSQPVIWYVQEDDQTWYTEYEGSPDVFLQSEQGRIWREELIPAAKWNHHSVKILATDSPESLAPFCARQNDVIEGRTYTIDEASAGAKVCLVSAAWAEKNHLHVGDTVSISIYTPEYEIIQFVGYREGEGVIGPDADQAHMILYPSCSKNDTGQTDEYEIVGVYACPPPEIGSLRFDPDTVLIPKGSVENADRYRTDDMSHYPLLNAYLLPNGAQDAFEEWLTEQGLKNCFLYYDYGYSAACEAIWEMRSNGTRLLIVGIAASALSIALFALLLRLLTAPTVRCMRLIGQSPKAIRKSFYRTIPLWTVPSMLSGGLFGWLLFGLISRTFLSASVAYDVKIAGLAALTQAAADSIALMLTGASTSRVPLMRGGKR